MESENMMQTPDGNWVPAVELPMQCEHGLCNNDGGKEYHRKKTIKGWEGEPIFLCDQHSKGYIPFSRQINWFKRLLNFIKNL